MPHPNNKTCSDCVHWKRCSWLLEGELDGTETECDWEPSRFKLKNLGYCANCGLQIEDDTFDGFCSGGCAGEFQEHLYNSD